jgi:hypothetical protein
MKMNAVLLLCAGLSALWTQPSHAQQLPGPQQFPETEKQKAEERREQAEAARKKAERAATDDAYNAMLEGRRPATSKKVDPWGALRMTPGK